MARNTVIRRYAVFNAVITAVSVVVGLFVGIADTHPQFVTNSKSLDSVFVHKHYYNASLVMVYLILTVLTWVSYRRYRSFSKQHAAHEVLNVGRKVLFFNTVIALLFTAWVLIFYLGTAAALALLCVLTIACITVYLMIVTGGYTMYQLSYAALLVSVSLNIMLNVQVLVG